MITVPSVLRALPVAARSSIRRIRREDLPAIAAALPPAPYRTHADDLEWHRTGLVTELIAWEDRTPVGSGFIHWPGPRERDIADRVGNCPEIFRLEVLPEHRSKGIGEALVRKLEALARARGIMRVGLGVGTANHRARSLYERLGYCPLGAVEYVDYAEYPDADGRRCTSEERCMFMVSDLALEIPAYPMAGSSAA